VSHGAYSRWDELPPPLAGVPLPERGGAMLLR